MGKKEKEKSKDIKKTKASAVIELASNGIRLKIAEAGKGKIKVIEALHYPISLGRDTFHFGKISFEKIDKACDILKNFLKVTSDYGVENIEVVGTTAIREAENRDYIMDQVKIKTGLTIKMLDDSQEKIYIHKELLRCVQENNSEVDSAMFVYIGSGNLSISVKKNNVMPVLLSIRTGSLRISEQFENIPDDTKVFHLVVEEYLEGVSESIKNMIAVGEIKNFVVSGQEIEMIAELCEGEKIAGTTFIKKEKFINLYDEIKFKHIEQMMEDYDMTYETAELLFPSMSIYKTLLEFTTADEIMTNAIYLDDAILYEMLYQEASDKFNKSFSENTILSARNLARRYENNEQHSNTVEAFSLKIFEKMKKIHGLGSREKLLLQVAAIVHDIGKFINMKDHYLYSYHIIKGSDIVGLTQLETELVANIAKYHGMLLPNMAHESYSKLRTKDRMIVSKLTAILRVADSLSGSHEQKFDEIELKIEGVNLVIIYSTHKNTQLEHWAFEEKSLFFEDVFGMKPIIKKKRVM